jgi:vacuolar-type H+-ATPase subunit F/Vma7
MRDEVIQVRLENTMLSDKIVELEQDRAATAIIHENAIAKLKKQIAKLKKEAKPITVKDLKLPTKATPPADAAVVTTRRRAPKSLNGDATNYR